MKYLERLLLLLAAFMLAGTNKCREDYFFATQARVSISPTTSGTVTGTVSATATQDDDGGGDEDLTPSPTATSVNNSSVTPTAKASVSATPSRTASATASSRTSALTYSRSDSGILGALKVLDQPDTGQIRPEATASGDKNTISFGSLAGFDGTWLGNMHKGSDEGEELSWSQDADKDGFADGLEKALGSDPFAANSFPANYQMTILAKRIAARDSDFDGLSNEQELQQGTGAAIKDSDSDGIADGLEFLSGTNPLDANSVPFDADADGLSDDYEISLGINPNLMDSDSDGLKDGLELEIGSNALVRDADLDGVFDGKEYQLGSDPLISDFPNQ